ncbi:MAG: Gfo/Idh/MocA family oxidoreductase [Magnetococcales bacterium]|nr:Gfo/Idh/MocA family oxidoreductase [Magnetococcales bacterium]
MSLPPYFSTTYAGGTPLRAAVIGAGYLGRFHAMKYAMIPGVDLVGIVDASQERVNAVSKELGTKGYTDYNDLLDSVDLVTISTPTPSHYNITASCLNAGVHVLVEKPITVTVDEADELIDIADRMNLVLQVGHLKRFHPAIVALKNSGVIKQPLFIESQRLAPFKSRALDVDVVLDLMIHDVDLILNFVDSELLDIDATGGKVVTQYTDIANTRLKFQNGCVANVTASRVSESSTRRIQIFQDDAFVSLDFITSDIKIMQRTQGEMELDGIMVPAIKQTKIPINKYDTLEAEIRSFCESVRQGTQPLVSGRDGRKALAVVTKIRESIAKSLGAS